jgi:uncharacterized protein involved in exopolysaccharide biosynthesis
MEEISFSDYIRTLKQRRRTIVATTLVMLVIVGLVLAVTPRTYMGEVTLIFPVQQASGLAGQLLQLNNLPMLSGTFNYGGQDVYMAVLKSRSLTDAVMQDLDLHAKYGIKRKEMMDALSLTNAKVNNSMDISFGVPTSWLKGKVPSKSLNDETAKLAADIANAYVKELRVYYRANSFSLGQKNCEFIEGQIARTKAQLTASEDRLERFQEAHPTLVPPEESSSYADQVLDLSAKQTENEIALADLHSQVEQARRTWKSRAPSGVSPASLVESPVVLDLQEQLSKLEVKRATLLEDFTEKHPSLIGVSQEIAKTKNKIDSEINRVVSGKTTNLHPAQQELLKQLVQLEIGLKGAQAKKDAFARAIGDSEKRLTALPEKETEYMRLLRDQKTAETVYTTLQAEQAKAQITKNQDSSNFVVLDRAEAEEHPSKPKIKITMGAALIMGMLLGILIASAQGPTGRKM